MTAIWPIAHWPLSAVKRRRPTFMYLGIFHVVWSSLKLTHRGILSDTSVTHHGPT